MKHLCAAVITSAGVATVIGWSAGLAAQRPPAFTLDDEMKVRVAIDARIAPDGERVAYVVSTPSLAKNEHEGVLFVAAASAGRPGDSATTFTSSIPPRRARNSGGRLTARSCR